ncbi:MAG: type III-B CRISPR module RAMP protein Cmr1 [Sphingobacteriia bacterium]|nr:type III-B CRISPR module RAMP protein Cmr1 [Sphingobacteriia bacterium]
MRTRQPDTKLTPDQALADWESASSEAEQDIWQTWSCKLITPLYGGGVKAGTVDVELPIRPSGLRGQLRFWWRIACGPFGSSTEMFQREAAIWGGIGSEGPTASKVDVRVDKISGLEIKPAFVYQRNPKKPDEWKTMPKEADWIEPYAVFPARGELTKDKRDIAAAPHRLALAGLGFRLGLKFHPDLSTAQREEITRTLRWWASFGGVGARTRRGLGAVRVDGLEPVTIEEVAARGGQLCCRPQMNSPETAWKKAIVRLREFRQGVEIGRNPRSEGSDSPAGRSRWPEPDMIRRQTGRNAAAHAPTHPVSGAVPRAAFGLPIVFHFKDENKGEPPQQLLVPEGGDRMASQLILRPYWDGQQWHSAALLLPDWEQRALSVRVGFGDGPFRPAWPADPAARQQLASQIQPMQGRGNDPLSAFMDFFAKD